MRKLGSSDIVGQASLLWKIVYATAELPAPSMTPSSSSVTRIWPSRRSPNSQLSLQSRLEFDSGSRGRSMSSLMSATRESSAAGGEGGEAPAVRQPQVGGNASVRPSDQVRRITDGVVELFYPEESLPSREEHG